MRAAVIGGTKFIGPAVVEDMLAEAWQVLVVHRGEHERIDAPDVPHAHLDRHDVPALRRALDEFAPDVVVDTVAYSRHDADTALAAIPAGTPTVVLSSQDVYRAFHALHAGRPACDRFPLDESAPLRGQDQRYLFRGLATAGSSNDPDAYENLDVEEAYLRAGATILRLPMVYGERDHMRREDFVLRRIRAGRRRIPIGAGGLLWTRCWVRDVARAVRLTAEDPVTDGGVFNVGEARTATLRQWAAQILRAAGSDAELVQVADVVLPDDLSLTAGSVNQHLLTDSTRFRHRYGWSGTDVGEAVERSVTWHLRNDPPDERTDFAEDDRALTG